MKTTISTFLAFLCLGNIKLSSAQGQQLPPGFPNFPGQQGGFPQGGFPGGFPGEHQGSFPGGIGGFPGLPGSFGANNKGMEELKRQCIANGGQAAYDDVERGAVNMQKCVVDVMPGIQSISDQTPGGICKFMQNTLHKCLVEFTSKLERCMDKATAYAPGFSVDIFDSVFKFLCKDDAKHIMTLITSMAQPSPCLNNLQTAAKNCLSETKNLRTDVLGNPGASTNLTKPELCSDTKILRDCVNKKSKEYCTGEMYEFVTGISNAIHEPCSACRIFITNTFVLLALFILTKLF